MIQSLTFLFPKVAGHLSNLSFRVTELHSPSQKGRNKLTGWGCNCYFCPSTFQLVVNSWFGLVVWIAGIPKYPNHRAPNQQWTISWVKSNPNPRFPSISRLVFTPSSDSGFPKTSLTWMKCLGQQGDRLVIQNFLCFLQVSTQRFSKITFLELWGSQHKALFASVTGALGIYMANNHGDRKSPKDRGCGTPAKWPFNDKRGWSKPRTSIGMILQVHQGKSRWHSYQVLVYISLY